MEFVYELHGHGWASGHIEINEKKCEFACSYLSVGIGELIERLRHLITDDPDINPNPIYWEEEPNGTYWTLKKIDQNQLLVRIEYEDEFEGKRELLLQETVLLKDFVNMILSTTTKLLQYHGIVGYRQSWGHEFPLADYLQLKTFLEDSSPIIVKQIAVEGYADHYTTVLSTELKILGNL
ncbi:hypothetical protein ACFOU2_07905 [Bacillus songklensis]|uniref:Uncharacterized protein n=1 Tax=Bacillus songklensis TaxID=1069116 RepID=A0ABV8B0T0_9BACI